MLSANKFISIDHAVVSEMRPLMRTACVTCSPCARLRAPDDNVTFSTCNDDAITSRKIVDVAQISPLHVPILLRIDRGRLDSRFVETFRDIVDGNSAYATEFAKGDLAAIPARHLAVVTCMDCRIDPLAIFGCDAGDVHVMRNAGARITPDMIRSLIKSVNQLEVNRIAVMHHTDCGAAKVNLTQLRAKVEAATGNDPDEVEFHLIADPIDALDADLRALAQCPFLPQGLEFAGFIYDVHSGIAKLHDTGKVGLF